MKLLYICFCLIMLTVNTVDPLPLPLPEKFTQSFTVSEQQGEICSGKLFYDSTTLSQKVSLVGGNADYYCGGGTGNSCSIMVINGTGYYILPEIKYCCHLDGFEQPSIPRDVLAQYYTFHSERFVDDRKCYLWATKPGQTATFWVYTDETQKRIMKRFLFDIMTHVSVVDFWDGSYSEKFSDKATFQVPTYCNQQCPTPGNANNLLWKLTLGLMQKAEPKQSKMQNLVAEE